MKESGSEPNWAELVFAPEFMAAINKLAVKRFGQGSLAEEAGTYVIEYLSQDDWQKCQTYQGKSQLKTFLYTLSSNAIEEFSRKRFGRPRPPSWLQDLGESWIKLWRSLCLERQPLAALVDRFCQRGFREPEAVQQAARVIKARIPTCGQSNRDTELADDINQLSDVQQAEAAQCDSEQPEFENPFHAELFMMISAVCNEHVCNDDFKGEGSARFDRLANTQQSKLDKLKQALTLKDQEKIMLRMIYVEGLSKSATSKALGLPAHQAGRIVNEAMTRIGEALRQCGLELDALLPQT
ncbi:MAG: hypothetical protein R3183_08550 [Oleiphilaceae bacterium]|nr:hypothetical protein [Oleiphilaceae bacterium]